MLEYISSFFTSMFSEQFTPHAFCLAWDPLLLGLTIFGNALTAISYILIPAQLLWILYRIGARPWILTKNRPILILFSTFILVCGVSHEIDIVVLWFPWYWLQGFWICLTGIISMVTALAMPYLIVTTESYYKEDS